MYTTTEEIATGIAILEGHYGSIDQVLTVVGDNFPDYRLGVEISLSAIATLSLKDNVNPAFLIKEGSSGSGKTTIDEIIGKIEGVTVWSDSFTPRAFLSHRADLNEENLAKIDLLRRIQHQVLITPDLAPTLGKRGDELRETVSILTRVLDGRGLETDSGAHGHRSASGDYLFVWLASTTPLSREAWASIGRAGTRAMFLQMFVEETEDQGDVDDLVGLVTGREAYWDKVMACHKVVKRFVKGFFEKAEGFKTIQWPTPQSTYLLRKMGKLTSLMVDYRAMEDADGEVVKDSRQRHFMLLYNLARGHALLFDRRGLTADDVTIVARVATDSVPHWRRLILQALVRKGKLSTTDVMRAADISRSTAIERMKELGRIGVVELSTPTGSFEAEHDPWSIKLRPEHEWVLEPDNLWLWEHLPR